MSGYKACKACGKVSHRDNMGYCHGCDGFFCCEELEEDEGYTFCKECTIVNKEERCVTL